MTTRNPSPKDRKTIPVRRPTRPGTFQPGAHAAAAARASQAKRHAAAPSPHAAPLGEPLAAPQRPPQADRIPERLGVKPEIYADAAAVVGLERAATVAPPSARIEIERLAPAWARGYLEPVTAEQIHRFGNVREYLRQTWGGGLYTFKVTEGDRGAWTAEQVQIAGPPKWEGAELAPPVPTMPAPPARLEPDNDIRKALGAILERLDKPRQVGEAAAAAAPAIGTALADQLEAWKQTNDRIGAGIEGRLAGLRGNPEPEPDDDDDDDDDDDERDQAAKPQGLGDVAETYFRQWLERVMPMPGGPTHKAPGEARGATTSPALSGTGPPRAPVPAERIT